MIPSLVAGEMQEAIVEYLSTTFALSDDEVRRTLARFLAHPTDGIFRGPFLRVRTPFRAVDDAWVSSLDWLPTGFVPYIHQGKAFERLSSRDHVPEPTLVTTGTGSGKTEAFLYPILDHCVREQAKGRLGVKALLLYPMNALATDQARRLARLLHDDDALSGVTAGLYVGGAGGHGVAGPEHLVDDRSALRANPPDILLTNYKMLDLLLLRRADRDLWVGYPECQLRYVVLDEFHTYDGAQGTDVAMLLRRLGAATRLVAPGRPLGLAVPVATSATLGAGTASVDAMRVFAERVFAVSFAEDSVIGESRQTAEEACGTVDYTLPIPDVSEVDVLADGDLVGLTAVFTGRAEPLDEFVLGDVLLHHPLTRAVLTAVSDRNRPWSDAVDVVVTRAPTWGAAAQRDPQAVHRTLARYLALLSVARRRGPDGQPRPLFAIEVQLWIREVSRLLRAVSAVPAFRWLDSGGGDPLDENIDAVEQPELPAAYCRLCGRAGWVAAVSELDGSLIPRPGDAYRLAVQAPARIRALIRAAAEEPDARHLEPSTGELLSESSDTTLPVLVTPGEVEAKRHECPSCGQVDGIRFLGSRVASLASVSITQLFGSSLVHSEERKLLVFTDSVQDASHRAAFFAGRTYRFNQRTLMAGIVTDAGRVSLDDLSSQLLAGAGADRASIHSLVPPDLLRHPQVMTLWGSSPSVEGRRILQSRLGLEASLEVGLRSRVGRTLELTGTVAAEVHVRNRPSLSGLVAEAWRHLPVQATLAPGSADTDVQLGAVGRYVRGLLERLRLQGGILHEWLWRYLQEDGNQWRIWGGREDGMPPFASGQSRPRFVTTKSSSESFDSITATPRAWTWWTDWARRSLGADQHTARAVNLAAFGILAAEGILTTQATPAGTVYALHPRQVVVFDVGEGRSRLRCSVCAGRHVVPPEQLAAQTGAPCMRFRCPGEYRPAPPDPSNYYRRLYRSRSMRRVVTAEHTGLLTRSEREQLETLFKAGTDPAAPNVVACTPTMELGIDIGDLSAVLLTSVPRGPANYVQRVGRAGRLTGNSFVAAFLPSEPRALYYLSQPEHLIAGEVRPPSCYLDAVEILRRQYLAYLIDRTADGTIEAPPMPPKIGPVIARGLEPDGWLRALLTASSIGNHAAVFVDLFGDAIGPDSKAAIFEYGAVGVDLAVKTAVADWNGLQEDLGRRRDRLRTTIERLEAKAHREEDEERELRSLRGERHAVVELIRRNREETTLEALVRIGLLPNYTMIDDAATLSATIWSRDEHEHYQTEHLEYHRPADIALTEFAPGNSFYVRGHKLTIDALDIGTLNEPFYEWWRLCQDCGFGAAEESEDNWDRCPRCRHHGIADAGARHLVLRPRQVFSLESEEQSRVFDDSDERDRCYYRTVRTLDVDPVDSGEGWRHTSVTFGVELDRVATIRTLNLGLSDRAGEQVRIGGNAVPASRFRTCRYCGTVAGARQRGREEHRGWCLTRSGARTPEWDEPILMHEIRTQAVRMLLPVSMFEVGPRLASFKGALLLGLRLDFGGEPEHLAVLTSDYPGSAGQGRRRFLVLYDTVPGGTGYLGRVADPERLRTILERARHAISVCPCRDEGRVACHRCLLGAVAPSEIELVSRTLALELLDTVLADWAFEPCGDLTSEDIGRVEESELERLFRVALRAWAAKPASRATLTVRPGTRIGGRDALELRLADASGQTARWLIEEQRDIASYPPTRPDYLITRQDATGLAVAVYLDGFQFHAAPGDENRLADDAAKRLAVRSIGLRVWNMTWNDVESFHLAAGADVPKNAADRALLPGPGRRVAQQVHLASGCTTVEVGAADHNPMRALLDYLRTPDDAAWGAVARAVAAGVAAVGTQVWVNPDEVAPVIDSTLNLIPGPDPSGGPDGWLRSRWQTANGLPVTCLLDARPEFGGANAERWTVLCVLDDRPAALQAPDHPARWRDWLQWANILQFLNGPGRQAVIATASGGGRVPPEDLDGIPGTTAPDGKQSAPPPEPMFGSDAAEELELILDPAARALTEDVLARGAPVPVAGHELEDGVDQGWSVEVAWPAARVAILADSMEARDHMLDATGWDARPATQWTVDDLRRVLEERA